VEAADSERPPWNPHTKTASDAARREARRRAVALAPSIRRAAEASTPPRRAAAHPRAWQPTGKIRYVSPHSAASSVASGASASPDRAQRQQGWGTPGRKLRPKLPGAWDGGRSGGGGSRAQAATARAARAIQFARAGHGDVGLFGGDGAGRGKSQAPPLPPRTKWTRRVPHPVLIGHAASLSQAGGAELERVVDWVREHRAAGERGAGRGEGGEGGAEAQAQRELLLEAEALVAQLRAQLPSDGAARRSGGAPGKRGGGAGGSGRGGGEGEQRAYSRAGGRGKGRGEGVRTLEVPGLLRRPGA